MSEFVELMRKIRVLFKDVILFGKLACVLESYMNVHYFVV
jgi:hypothetical protein